MSDKDILIANLLKEYQPGSLPYPIFEQIARIVALPIVEFVPLRLKNNMVEVLLISRPSDDPYWPSMLHTPGTVIRATDLNNEDSNYPAFKRIIHDELKNVKVGPPHYVGSQLHLSKRGTEQAQLYWIEVLEETEVGSFYNVNNLPGKLINSQTKFIKEAARNYRDYLRKNSKP